MNGNDFPKFFDAVWRREGSSEPFPPFPWQARLARQVVESGKWPSLLDLPTGSGKTAVIDIAIFALACRPEHFPRRTIYVVDRRIVVDQVARRVERISERLAQQSADPVVGEVAERLRAIFGGDKDVPPIHLAELRGGIAMDTSWCLRPDMPAVLVSTVDQVGSRLLHRGYGVKDYMLSVHAGLTGNDCLYVLDEVHLSQPFAETLDAIQRDRGDRSGLPDRLHVVQLSATPGTDVDSAFRLEADDRNSETCPVLARRLAARKNAVAKVVGRPEERAEESLPPFMKEVAQSHTGTVAVIVNRVETARRVAELLEECGDDVLLVTGRMRPLERDELLSQFADRIVTGRDRSVGHPRLFLVGTQSLEVGADFDVDALVTECASWDALRQRFGRVDRDGLLSEAGTPADIMVVKAASSSHDDPIYGPAMMHTWKFLSKRSNGFDAGVEPHEEPEREALSPRRSAPLLLSNHWRTWAQTHPRPHVEPDPSLWLHGPEPSVADVDVVWRDDLTQEVVTAVTDDRALRLQVQTMVRLLPPLPGEALSVPIGALRAWLAGRDQDEVPVADAEGRALGCAEVNGGPGRLALRVRGSDVSAVAAKDVRRGDTLLVPCSYGGISRANWAPQSGEAVSDLARVARRLAGRDDVVRLLPDSGDPPVPDPLESLDDRFPDLVKWSEEHLGCRPARSLVTVLDYSPAGSRFFVIRFPREAPKRAALDATAGLDKDGTDEMNSFVGSGVGLRAHCEGVGRLAGAFARRLGLSDALVADLELAGRVHDLGKADARFQRWLSDGVDRGELLAKSELHDPRAIARARDASGYPHGARHELMSLALLDSDETVLGAAEDPELVRHLVASHHGWCRPWAPAISDTHPLEVEAEHDGHVLRMSSDHGLASAGSGVADRFFALLDRYGWHGLAWLECIFRLADHRQSQLEDR